MIELLAHDAERGKDMITSAIAQERVARGAALLDRHQPGWFTQINREILNMSSSNCCVVGQVCGGYYQMFGFGGHGAPIEQWGELVDPAACGFWADTSFELSILQEAWLALIVQRLALDTLTHEPFQTKPAADDNNAPVVTWTHRYETVGEG